MDTLHVGNNEEYLKNPVNDIEYQKVIELMNNCKVKVDVYCDLFGDNGKYNCRYATCPWREAYLEKIREEANKQNQQDPQNEQ